MRPKYVLLATAFSFSLAGCSSGGSATEEETAVSESVTGSTATKDAVAYDSPKSFAVGEVKDLKLSWLPDTAVLARDRRALFVYPYATVAVSLPGGGGAWVQETAIEGLRLLSGEPQWALSPALSGDGAQLYSAVPLVKPGVGTVRDSLQLLLQAQNVETGKRTWKNVMAVPIPRASGGFAERWVGSWESKALGEAGGNVIFGYNINLLDFQYLTIAVSKADGQVKWTELGEPHQVSADRVIVTRGGTLDNQLAALDANTGKTLWLTEKSFGYTPHSLRNNVLDVSRSGGSDSKWLKVDITSGKVLSTANEGIRGMNLRCRPDQKADLIVCSDTQSTWAFADKVLWQLPSGDRGSVEVSAVYAGQVYGEGPTGPVVLDARTGKDVTTSAGIAPTVVTPYAGIAYDKDSKSWKLYPSAS